MTLIKEPRRCRWNVRDLILCRFNLNFHAYLSNVPAGSNIYPQPDISSPLPPSACQLPSPPSPMASPKDLSTPQCPAEQHAWLLIYQKRLGRGTPLAKALNRQFPEREHNNIFIHASRVRDAKGDVQAQLQDLAEQCPWYEKPLEEGEPGYALMKNLEKEQKARDRKEQKQKRREREQQQPGKVEPFSNS
ncbi:hypothetical protein HO173_000622 [Letharia columbiana]|uniref:Uncharacterized protein n=1 Tax=Letharia columbiana TaxID=112416 RepID=A0A8H6G7L9_9LECA|nr:uncharacterized protein HO173_000622 [Letharia columbiana]KAF6241910.1 hypothetical protein HO173_000622 [Letharia columbiana]